MSLCRSELSIPRPPDPGLMPARFFRLVGFGLCLILPALALPARLGVVSGCSMQPTLSSGQPFLYRRFSPERETLQREELVVVRLRGDLCIKRVYALERDRFWSLSAASAAEGVPTLVAVDDPIALWRHRYPGMDYRSSQVPPGCVYVVGDAATNSLDSRQLGPVSIENVVGRVVWPTVGPPPAGGSVSYWADRPAPPSRASGRVTRTLPS
ncbi:MAG: signal peptidase [Armatimonadetes bacterium]|jgi:signal peptidase I|nr:signal peptidase [Armatimonadota bacterium]